MAEYKIVDAEKLDSDLKTVADSIRAKGGTNTTLSFPEGFNSSIASIKAQKEEQAKIENITDNGTYTITPDEGKALSSVVVNVKAKKEEQEKIFNATTEGEYTVTPDSGKVFSSVTVKVPITFMDWATNNILSKYSDFDFTGITTIRSHTFSHSHLKTIIMPDVTTMEQDAFNGCNFLSLDSLPTNLTKLDFRVFYDCYNITINKIPMSIQRIEANAFYGCRSLTEMTFEGTPSFVNAIAFYNCPNLTTINVPWAEGEVENAPWGAVNATINYNYTGG